MKYISLYATEYSAFAFSHKKTEKILAGSFPVFQFQSILLLHVYKHTDK